MAKLMLNLMGGFQALLDGEPVTNLTSDKTRALLAYLVMEAERPHRRESLCALLWPNAIDSLARQSLSQALSILRKVLRDDNKAQPFLLADRDTVQFNPHSDYALDTEYRGPFLAGFTLPDAEGFEEWVLLERESRQREALEKLDKAVTQNIEQTNYDKAIESARKQLEIDPWREETHRSLMHAYALNGQRGDALAQFEKCKQVLREALGVEPSNETKSLLARIQQDAIQGKPATIEKPRLSVFELPTALTPFIGRESELAALNGLMANPDARLITLVGVGGMGKTRLAIQTAALARSQFENGVAFVPLTALETANAIAAAIATTLRLTLYRPDNPREDLIGALRDASLLLVLDNFEHLLGSETGDSAAFVIDLLQAVPRLKLLITSREALDVPGEWVQDVFGLGADARDLFVQSSQRVRVGFELNAEDERAVNRICNLVDGMPLGIELAASWTRLLSCADIVAEIEKSIGFLQSTTRQLPARHRSITAVLEYSWHLLNEHEREAMLYCAQFRGDFSRDAAQVVARASLTTLSSLVARSLLRRVGNSRYDLHQLMRQFVLEQLQNDTAKLAIAQYRYTDWCIRIVEPGGTDLDFQQQMRWFETIDAEHTHVYAVLDSLLKDARPDALANALRITGALWRYWYRRDDWLDGRRWTERAMALVKPEDHEQHDPVRMAQLLAWHGVFLSLQADLSLSTAEQNLNKGIALLRASPTADVTRLALAYALMSLGWVRFRRGDHTQTLTLKEESIELFRQTHDRWGLSQALVGLRQVLMAMGEFARTRDAVQESAMIAREIRDDWGLAMAHNALGELARNEGNFSAALSSYMEAIDLFRKARARINENISVLNSVVCYVALGQPVEAARLLWQGAQEAQNTQSILLFVNTLFTFGIFSTIYPDDERVTHMGVRALGSDMTFLAAVDARLDSIDQAAVDRAIENLKARLGHPRFEAIWAEGSAIPPLDAVNECIATLAPIATLRESPPDAHRDA